MPSTTDAPTYADPADDHDAPRPPATSAAGSRLDALDDALVGLRRAQQQPAYRRALLAGIDADIELATVRVLRAVQRAGSPPSIGDVAERLVVDASTASRFVDRAVSDGWLVRRACADDRRRTRLELTPAGARVLDRVTAQRRRILAQLTHDLEPEDVDRFVELLSLLTTRLDAVGAPS